MLKALSVSFVMLCVAIGGLNVPSYTVNVELENKEEAFDKILEQGLEEKLREIEEALNYSSQIKILDLKYEENVLTIDLSQELTAYKGGNAAEAYVAYTLLDWGFQRTNADYITLLIEGEMNQFPEGGVYTLYMREDYETFILPKLSEQDEGPIDEKNNICNTESR